MAHSTVVLETALHCAVVRSCHSRPAPFRFRFQKRPFSAWNLQNHSAGIQDINFDSVPNGSSFFAKHTSSTFLRKRAMRQFAHCEPLGCCSSCVLASVTTISRTTGWPSGMSDRCLSDSAVRRDNSDRCIAVSMRRKEWPRTKTSWMAKTSRRCCS